MNKKEFDREIQQQIIYSFQSDDWHKFVTQEHIELINKSITKALKNLQWEEILQEFLQSEFDHLYESCDIDYTLQNIMAEALRTHFIRHGLIDSAKNIQKK